MNSREAVPLLPCVQIDATLDFYGLLGFVATHRQRAPNAYAATRREGAQLHFFGLKGLEPKKNFSCCIIVMNEVERTHQVFAEALRGEYGKVPLRGIPRISRMRPGQSRFTVVDPSGNSVMFIRHDEPDEASDQALSPLGQALRMAKRLRDFRTDDAAAAKVLDVALRKAHDAPAAERARALVVRAELAIALDDAQCADAMMKEYRELALTDAEREELRGDIEAFDKLAKSPDA